MYAKTPKRGRLVGICAVVLSLLLIAVYTAPVLAEDRSAVLDFGENGKFDERGVFYPWVIKDGNTYKMWYTGKDSSDIWRIGYATSPDGIHWNRQNNGNPVLNPSAGDEWDSQDVYAPCVIKDGENYKMWYSGRYPGLSGIGYATSSDGITWSKSGSNPVLAPGAGGQWDSDHIFAACVIKNETNKYEMWYSGSDGSAGPDKIGYATSPTGEHAS
jgi:hypothetical protein